MAIAGQSVRLYADDGGASVMLRAGRSGGGEATIWMTVSGHLVDVPWSESGARRQAWTPGASWPVRSTYST